MDSRRSSKPLLAAGALLLAAAAILVLSTRRDRPAQPAVEHQVQAAEGDVASAARSRLEAARQRAASDGVAGPPVIDAVVIEKTALCEGEENLVLRAGCYYNNTCAATVNVSPAATSCPAM